MTPARNWMQSHGINLRLAAAVGLHAEGDTLYAPYERPDGSCFERYRSLPDGYWMQPKGESLCCWWPCGGRSSSFILLTEGEGDTLAAASVLCDEAGAPRSFAENHPLLGLCPIGLPGTAFARKAVEELKDAGVVYIALDGDEPGQKATAILTTGLAQHGVQAIPVALPQGRDLAEYLGWDTDGDPREDVLGHLLADAEAHAEDRRQEIEMGDINAKLGRAA